MPAPTGSRRCRRRQLSRFHQFAPGGRHQTDVVLPPKSDTGYARENKIDDLSAVLRYGVVSTTNGLREHGREDAVP
jgi:hypothetical protein